MRANLTKVISAAGNGAVGSFNILDLNMAFAIIESAEALELPVIIGVASRHFEAINALKLAPSLIKAIEQARVPIALHLDHASPDQYPMVIKALDAGFNSIMIDGSHLPYDENASVTSRVVQTAMAYGASVEGELGGIAGEEGVADTGHHAPEAEPFTDAAEANRFVKDTGVDALAIAVGTAHGIYEAQPEISFATIENCAAIAGAPLVMHGATGVADADIQLAVRSGIRKINYFSGLLKGGMDTVRCHATLKGNDMLAFNQGLRTTWRELVSEQMRLYAVMPKHNPSIAA